MHDVFSAKSLELMLVVAGSTALIYLYLILLMRLAGRHTLSQLSPLDLLIVMLLGSSVETSMVHGSTLLRCGFVSATVLLASNRVLTIAMGKSRRFKHLVGGGPMILVSNGHLVEENLLRSGLTKADVLEALRERECGDVAEVRLAVMEPDGTINVLANAAT